MKNILTTLLAVLGLCSIAAAQQSKGIEFAIGIGINGANFSQEMNVRNKAIAGFNAAVSADYYFSDRWSLKVKAIYDQKGSKNAVISSADMLYESDARVNYITVPVMANWHFGKTRNWYLNFGPYVGNMLSAKAKSFDGVTERSVKYRFRNFDAGVAYGIGVKLPLNSKMKLYLEIEGQNSLTDVSNSAYSTNYIKNERGSFNIGFNF